MELSQTIYNKETALGRYRCSQEQNIRIFLYIATEIFKQIQAVIITD